MTRPSSIFCTRSSSPLENVRSPSLSSFMTHARWRHSNFGDLFHKGTFFHKEPKWAGLLGDTASHWDSHAISGYRNPGLLCGRFSRPANRQDLCNKKIYATLALQNVRCWLCQAEDERPPGAPVGFSPRALLGLGGRDRPGRVACDGKERPRRPMLRPQFHSLVTCRRAPATESLAKFTEWPLCIQGTAFDPVSRPTLALGNFSTERRGLVRDFT